MSDFGHTRVVVSQQSVSKSYDTKPNQAIIFDVYNSGDVHQYQAIQLMDISPLHFAKEFAKFKVNLSKQPLHELQLLYLTGFYLGFEKVLSENKYKTYLLEILPLFDHLLTEQTLVDYTIEELERLKLALVTLQGVMDGDSDYSWISQKSRLVKISLARLLFYVGDIKRALPVCGEIAGLETSSTRIRYFSRFGFLCFIES